MKRRQLLKYILKNGCSIVREGAKHTLVKNDATGALSTIPRHSEINEFLAKKILKDLQLDV